MKNPSKEKIQLSPDPFTQRIIQYYLLMQLWTSHPIQTLNGSVCFIEGKINRTTFTQAKLPASCIS